MIEHKVLYESGGIELLDKIRPLWEQLNQHHATVSTHFSGDFHAKNFAGRKKTLLEKYAEGKLRIDIAHSQEHPVGYLVSAIRMDGVGEIESIYIKENYRRQAIGDRLMRQAMKWLDTMDIQTKLIDVAVGNERALKFYARFGFYPRVVTLKQKIPGNE